MLVYLALLRFPPWAALSRVQRRFVWREFIQPLLTRWPLSLAKSFVLFIALLAVVLPSGFHGAGSYVAFFLAVMFTTDLLDLFLVAGYRMRIGQYIREHATEIDLAV
jgi:hypothetical protein